MTETAPSSRYRLLPIFSGIFTACLLISNTIAFKMVDIFGFTTSAGLMIFPLSYLFGDILTEVYGYSVSRRVVWTGFLSMLLMVTCYTLGGWLPPASFWDGQAAYQRVFSSVPRTVAASMLAYFVGEFCNSYVLARLKVQQEGGNPARRFILSTMVGEAADTMIFYPCAFWGIVPPEHMLQVGVTAWAAKVAWEVLALPISLPLTRMIKRIEHEDYFDTNTDFNPFKI